MPLESSDFKGATRIRLLFHGWNELATADGQSNIFRWYALKTRFQSFDGKATADCWTIFLVFDREVKEAMNVNVSIFANPKPLFEVKDQSSRSLIIAIAGDPPAGTAIEISLSRPKIDGDF